jgi:hypothetical protein
MMICHYINSGQSNFEFEYIGEFETEFNTFLEYESGAQVGSIDRKKQRAKISCHCPFKYDTVPTSPSLPLPPPQIDSGPTAQKASAKDAQSTEALDMSDSSEFW